MLLYLCGPMTGRKSFNYPEFNAWAAELRHKGYDVSNPANTDNAAIHKAALNSKFGDIADLPDDYNPLETALKNVADVYRCHGVALLDGWEKSAGAVHEVATAVRFGIPTAPINIWVVTAHA